jgi:ribulose-5-phosphate 4-epimerase/fuculose-1-phosphate aldolase
MSVSALDNHRTAGRGDSEERQVRVDVAAAYRLLHGFGFTDLTDGFVCGRLGDQQLIMGGYGVLPDRVCASQLHVTPLQQQPAVVKHGGVDFDAVCFSQTVFGARPEFRALIHAHPPCGMIFSATEAEIEPISQAGIMYYEKVGYILFDEDVTSRAQREEMAAHFASGKEALILRNHGFLVPGRTVADAVVRLYRLEQACKIQLGALASGVPRVFADAQRLDEWRAGYWTNGYVDNDGSREWPAFLARLDATQPEFRG